MNTYHIDIMFTYEFIRMLSFFILFSCLGSIAVYIVFNNIHFEEEEERKEFRP